jgi:hypothetical protein
MNVLLIDDEEQRKDFASNLHNRKSDLSVLRLFLQKHENVKYEAINSNKFIKEKELIDDIVTSLQVSSKKMYPQLAKFYGFIKYLQVYTEELANKNNIKINFNNLLNQDFNFPEIKGLFIYRVYEEIFHQLIKTGNNLFSIDLFTENEIFYFEFHVFKKLAANDVISIANIDVIKARLICLDAYVSYNTDWKNLIKIGFSL